EGEGGDDGDQIGDAAHGEHEGGGEEQMVPRVPTDDVPHAVPEVIARGAPERRAGAGGGDRGLRRRAARPGAAELDRLVAREQPALERGLVVLADAHGTRGAP